MADAAGSRRPSQPSTPVSPAGVGASGSNRGSPRAMVSPSILQEILESGDQPLIDDALEQWDTTAMGQLLSTLPSPDRGASPAGVGSAASNRSSPSPAAPAPQTPAGAVAAVTAGVGAGGSGGGGSSGGSSSSGSGSSRSQRSSPSSGASGRRSGTPTSPAPAAAPAPAPAPVAASTPRGRPTQAQKEPRRGLGGRGRGRGRGRGGRGRGGRGGRPARPNSLPSRPWTSPSPSQQGSPQAPLNQADLQRRLRMLLQDQEAIAAGRRIANITTTNSIVTSYKEGGRPSVQTNSSRFSP